MDNPTTPDARRGNGPRGPARRARPGDRRRGCAAPRARANGRRALAVGHFEGGGVGQWRAAPAFTAHIMWQSRAGKGK